MERNIILGERGAEKKERGTFSMMSAAVEGSRLLFFSPRFFATGTRRTSGGTIPGA